MAKPEKTGIPSLATMVQESFQEATQTVEDLLRLEDTGWTNFSQQHVIISDTDRINNLKLSRLYALKDPLGKQSIRLWTDYSFGRGIAWSVPEEEKATREVLEAFWGAAANRSVLAPTGQRMGSNKLLIDGEVFFAIFLGAEGKAKIRRIHPLEIAEIITDPEDIENVLYYRRTWTDRQGSSHETIYRDITNIEGESGKSLTGATIERNDDALIYHLAYNTTEQRGNPLLLPALDWIKLYRRFLGSRIAIMLALAKFAWKAKV
ncbi:MAG: hypothetical protein KAU10_05165, partial [Dehalococcoidia bacterium]|nr:hypothetical protein [Dehalococcoidia bacterium]